MDKCPLTGLPCNQQKCIHLTDIKDYKAVKTLDLCKLCGSKFMDDGMDDEDDPMKKIPQAVADFLTILDGLLKQKMGQMSKLPLHGPQIAEPIGPVKPPCPQCGITLEEIATLARLGCPYCYAHFGEELLPVLHAAHKSIKHVGKVPKEWQKRKRAEESTQRATEAQKVPSVEELEQQMNECLEIEDYETAAKIRDQIKELKKP
jgi:protein-arginine kinase activator protein McsA